MSKNSSYKQQVISLNDFIPQSLFDSHVHLYRKKDIKQKISSSIEALPDDADAKLWRKSTLKFCNGKNIIGGIFIPYPTKQVDFYAANTYLLEQLKLEKNSFGLILIPFGKKPDFVDELINNKQIIGFKPYHILGKKKNTFECKISEFVPEWAWELAHSKGYFIMLHLVRERALADENNLKELIHFCTKYPAAKVILAHAARGFHASNTVEGVRKLGHLENVWFDSSSICEVEPLLAILDKFGPKRLLWASDFPISLREGKCVSIGNSFAWINPERIDTQKGAPECGRTLVGIESLFALKKALDIFGASKADIEDIFSKNAMRLFSLQKEEKKMSLELYAYAKQIIPGGTQLLSKRPEMFAPNQWPAYFSEARGCEIWDIDGRHYYDMSIHSVGACLLGYSDPDVNKAVIRRIRLGNICSLNPPDEVRVADMLFEIHPWAKRARFARSGGEICGMAVRIARATTNRSLVAICGYHGWHDWYLAANLGENDSLKGHLLPGLDPSGVPIELRGTAFTFTYNNREQFKKIIDNYGNKLAAVIMEPCRNYLPEKGFLEFVKEEAHKAGALLIFDEISIGWRYARGGAHLKLGVNPDIAIFSKATSNGYPFAAVIGTKEAMEGAEKSFISSTYWTEGVGPAAAIATISKHMQIDVPSHVEKIGTLIQAGWRKYAALHKLPIEVGDFFPCLASFKFNHPEADALKTLFIQLMLERGFLASLVVYPTLAHAEEIVEKYLTAVDEVFGIIAKVLAGGDIKAHLKGPVAHSGFRRLL